MLKTNRYGGHKRKIREKDVFLGDLNCKKILDFGGGRSHVIKILERGIIAASGRR